MKKTLKYVKRILVFCFIFSGFESFAQENLIICNKYKHNIDKSDVNQIFINRRVKKTKKLKSEFFRDAIIAKNTDSIRCKVYCKDNSVNRDMFLYILVKYDTSKYIHVLTGRDISEFCIDDNYYYSHVSDNNGIKSYSFIKLVHKGKVILYEREGIPSNYDFVYFFKKRGEASLKLLTPYASNIKYYAESQDNEGKRYFSFSTNCIDEKFKIAFNSYFSDCPEIVNKIMSGFYSINNFSVIVKNYNIICN